MDNTLRIGDLVEVPPVQTVIRLEEGRSRSELISKSFVFTEEVASHFSVMTAALLKDSGRGFFLQGDFGSGKSHFLACLTAWLAGRPGTDALEHNHRGLQRLKAAGRNILPVDISLVNYRATTSLEQIVVEAIEASLRRHGTPVQLTPLAAFLDDFKVLLQTGQLAEAFCTQVGIPVADVSVFLADHPRRAYVEAVRFMKDHGLPLPSALVEERHETFTRAIHSIRQAGFDGLMLIIDELSEFFRSKPDARGLNEDARTLQLLGELCQSAPIWIIAAVQESIEKTGDILPATFRKIKDRFPVKLTLSSLHIKALISRRLVHHKPGAADALYGIYEFLRRQFPSVAWHFEDFQATYPVHPATIALLDGLGDLFSEHRGIVDFVHSRLAGDPSRQIAGILERPSHELLGPDSIYDHFCGRMAEFSAFYTYPQHIVPHLDEIVDQVIEAPEDRILARRIIRTLVLYNIHPTANIPTARQLTALMSCAISDQDPDLNVQFVAETILDPVVQHSRFLVKSTTATGDNLDAVYKIVTQEDPSKMLAARITRRAAEIPADDSRLLLQPLSELPESASWPGPDLMQRDLQRSVPWRHSSRRALVAFLVRGKEALLHERIEEALSAGQFDFAVVISLGPAQFFCRHTAVWEMPLAGPEEKIAALRQYLAACQIAGELRPANPADAALVQPAQDAVERLRPAAHQAVLQMFYAGHFTEPGIFVEEIVRQMMAFGRLLEEAGNYVLESRYPGYREIAPRKVVPSRLLYQRLIDEFVFPGSLGLRQAHSLGLSDAIEGLATPLGLVELRSGTYIFAPDPENHPLLAALFGVLKPAGPTRLDAVLHALGTGRYGVPADTVYFLLSALAHGGLISLLKNGRILPLEFLRLSAVEKADALAPGEVIGKHDRQTLVNECPFLSPPSGWQSFGLRQQREVWQALIKLKERLLKTAVDIDNHLTTVAGFSAFKAFDLEGLQSQLAILRTLAAEIKVSYPAREGIERFLKAWRDSGFCAADLEFIFKMKSFLSRSAEQFVFVNHYVRHPAVAQTAAIDQAVGALQSEVVSWLDQPDQLINDDPARLSTAFERFRTVYAQFYSRAHDDYYRPLKKKPLARSAKRALALLQRLAAIEILDRPAGINDFFRRLSAPSTDICKRNLSEELLRAPICTCGFIPGQAARPVQIENPANTLEEYLKTYCQILSQAEVREAVAARIFALADADPDSTERLRNLSSVLEQGPVSSTALLDVLDDVTAGEIDRALAGRVQIEKRKLKDLVGNLGGRRLRPSQVLEAVKNWVGICAENTVIAFEDEGAVLPTGGLLPQAWWPAMHQEIFADDARPAVREIEAVLERQYPAASLKNRLERLDDGNLARFISREPFHTQALRAAWLLFAGRILSETPWPSGVEIGSRHADSQIAGNIRQRLDTLKIINSFGKAQFPDRLRLRTALSRVLADSWASTELRALVQKKIRQTARAGDQWLATLPAVAPVELSANALVVILDGVSPDVWLETLEQTIITLTDMTLDWYRLEVVPRTAESIAALFGFAGDALDEFDARNIAYYQIRGDESHGLADLLPEFSLGKPAVIRISLVDRAAHAALLRLAEMPAAICGFLEKELPWLQQICVRQERRLILTTDHGLSLTASGLSHGKGGVFERAIFRAQWRYQKT